MTGQVETSSALADLKVFNCNFLRGFVCLFVCFVFLFRIIKCFLKMSKQFGQMLLKRRRRRRRSCVIRSVEAVASPQFKTDSPAFLHKTESPVFLHKTDSPAFRPQDSTSEERRLYHTNRLQFTVE